MRLSAGAQAPDSWGGRAGMCGSDRPGCSSSARPRRPHGRPCGRRRPDESRLRAGRRHGGLNTWPPRHALTGVGLRGRLRCRGRCRHGRRRRLRRGRSGSRRRGRGTRRQQRERVDVALRVVGASDPEVYVGDVDLGVAGRSDRSNRLLLGDAVAGIDREGPEVEERDGEAVARPDRHDPAVGRKPARERHLPGGGRPYRRARRAADVDAGVAMFTVFLPAELEAAQNRAVRRPAPRMSGSRRGERNCDQYDCRCLSRKHRQRPRA
jgi:hypothetical protein